MVSHETGRASSLTSSPTGDSVRETLLVYLLLHCKQKEEGVESSDPQWYYSTKKWLRAVIVGQCVTQQLLCIIMVTCAIPLTVAAEHGEKTA